MALRQRIEKALGAWGGWVSGHRALTIFAMVGLALGLATRLPYVEIDTSTESWLRGHDPVKLAYDELRERFGRDQLVILAIEPPSIFDLEFLATLRRLHVDLTDRIPYLDRVTSLVNIRSIYGLGDELVVEDLMEEMPQTAADLEALRARVMSTPSYLDGVISADGRITSIIIETDAYSSLGSGDDLLTGFDDESPAAPVARVFLNGDENAEIVRAVKDVVAEYQAPDFPIQIAGSVLLPYELQMAMVREMPLFSGVSLLVMGGLLFVLFRRIAPVLLTLAVVVLAIVTTMGLSDLMGIGLTLSSQILPSFLLAVGIGYSVHLIAIFLQHLDEHGDRRAALVHALEHSGLPILMTGVTTVAGMLSFLAAELSPINEFGIVGSLGVGATLVYSLVLLPALLAAVPMKPRPQAAAGELHDRLLSACGMMAARNPWKVVLVVGALGVISVGLAAQVRFSSNPLEYLPESHDFRTAMNYVDERMGGALTIELVVDTDRENGLQEPDVLNRMEEVRRRVGVYRDEGLAVRGTSSLLDVVKESHQALNENRSEFYAIPQDRSLVAQELLLFENSGNDELERLVDSQFSVARMSVRNIWLDGFELEGLLDRAAREFPEIMGSAGEITITGMSAVITGTVRATIRSLARSYSLALILITPLMMLLIGSLRSGLVSMVPNLIPIAMTLALMTLMDITLDMFTLMIGCIAIGLAVDDTIHLISGFRRYLAETRDPMRAVERALETTGRALLFTSVVLTCGFLVFVLSSMGNLRDFGVLTAFAVGSAFVLDITATPALLMLVTRRQYPMSGTV